MNTTVNIIDETAKTIRELSTRTGIPAITLLKDIFAQIQLQLDMMSPNKRLLFLADFDNKNRMTHIRLSDALQCGSLGSLDLPKSIKKELQAQIDKENEELRGKA